MDADRLGPLLEGVPAGHWVTYGGDRADPGARARVGGDDDGCA